MSTRPLPPQFPGRSCWPGQMVHAAFGTAQHLRSLSDAECRAHRQHLFLVWVSRGPIAGRWGLSSRYGKCV